MNEEIILNVEQGQPYGVGARAYVEQTEDGAVITIIDKDGTTTATVNNGADGVGISSVTLNGDYTLTINYSDGTSVTTTSIRGETGASGVYCGTEEPLDPAIEVWVDPSGGDAEDGSVLRLKEEDEWKPIPSIVGEAAGFGTVTATVDTNVGTPAVVVTSSGEDTAKNFAFQFKNLGYDDSDLQDDFADLASDFDVLQGQFDTAVAAVTTDTEVTDIRVGADGVTDTTAGASVRRQFTDVKSDLNSVFNYDDTVLTLSALTDGYISKTGEVTGTGASARHASFAITSDYVNKNFKVTGSNWFNMKPFVFVGSDSTIVYADCPSSSLSVYTDLPFKPTTTGTLYVNHHTDSATYGAKINEIGTLKDTALPDDLASAVEYVGGYKTLSFTTTSHKYLNASNGVISDLDSDNAVVTGYIPVDGGTPYLITTEHFWGRGLYAFYDANQAFISGVASANSGTITQIRNQKVVAPQNAAYLVVGMWLQNNFPSITVCEGEYTSISPALKWNGKKWACVGDSLTEQNIKAVRHYYDYVSEATGIAPVILGVGGTGYARGQESNNAFYQRVSAVPSDADVITIFGSFNDLGANLPIGSVDDVNTTTIAGCINTTINNILTINPIANIGIIAPCPWSTTQPTESGGEYQYVSMIEAICKRRSIPYLDLWHYSGMRPWDSSFANLAYPSNDTIHPNDVGHSILAPKFKAFLESLLM